MYQPSCIHTYDHVYHGPSALLPWYLLIVCHLEYRSQYCPFIHPRIIYLDSLARDLLASTKTDLCQVVGYGRYGSQIQAQSVGQPDLECRYYFDVSGTFTFNRPRSAVALSSSCFGDGYWEAYSTGSCILYEPGRSRIQGRILPFPGGSEAERRISFFAQHNRWQLISLSLFL